MEHWKKVHRKHCKYMANKKSSSVKKHSDNCSKCKYEEDSFEDIKQVDNPFYPCHIKYSYNKPKEDGEGVIVRDYISLGELGGQFVSKMDKNLSILQHIAVKLNRLYPSEIDQEHFDSMVRALLFLRDDLHNTSTIYPNEVQIDAFVCRFQDFKIKTVDTSKKEDVWRFLLQSAVWYHALQKIDNDDNYKWWSSFTFFLNLYLEACYFYKVIFDIQFIKDEDFGDNEHIQSVKALVSQNNFLETWSKLLDSCTEKMVPFNDLLQMYCGGKLERECNVCSDNISVSTFNPFFLINDIISLNKTEGINIDYKELLVDQNHVDRFPKLSFICRKISCRKENKSSSATLEGNLVLISSYIQTLFSQNRCDSCFHLSLKVHRCSSCKTKLYCSEKCQAEDWKVHKFCCEELRKQLS